MPETTGRTDPDLPDLLRWPPVVYPFMNFPPAETESLISALRDELQERGALLHLLEAQQRAPREHKAGSMLELSAAIRQRRSEVVRSCERRQKEFRSLVKDDVQAADAGEEAVSLESLLPHFPITVVPMIQGLVGEVNQLISRGNGFSGDQ